MLGKALIFTLLAAAMLFADASQLRQAGRKERVVYGALFAAIVYLGVIFIARKLNWPNLNTLFDLLKGPAGNLVRSLS